MGTHFQPDSTDTGFDMELDDSDMEDAEEDNAVTFNNSSVSAAGCGTCLNFSPKKPPRKRILNNTLHTLIAAN